VGQPPGLLDDAVDRFCPAVADAAGCEVGQDLLAPAAQSLAESLDLVIGQVWGVSRSFSASLRPVEWLSAW
jgi:hypothetical protein